MLDDIDLDIPSEEAPGAPEPSRSRFVTTVGILGGVLVLAILAIGAYSLFVLPQQQAAEQERLADETSTAIAIVQSATDTPTLFPTATNTATNTATLEPSSMPTEGINGATQTVEAVLTQAAIANDAGGGGEAEGDSEAEAQAATEVPTEAASPTVEPVDAGAEATQTADTLLTQAADAQASQTPDGTTTPSPTPTATPSSLPETGFADEASLPLLLLSTGLLLFVVLLARRLRRQLA